MQENFTSDLIVKDIFRHMARLCLKGGLSQRGVRSEVGVVVPNGVSFRFVRSCEQAGEARRSCVWA